MFKKLKSMKLKKRLNYGYRIVIMLMVISGVLSIISMGALYTNLNGYLNGAQAADTAVKMCRIDINIAARTVREMSINPDKSTYTDYRAQVEEKLEEIGTYIEDIKKADVIDTALIQEYETALTEWGQIGYSIMKEVEAGNLKEVEEMILSECVPALDHVIELSKEFDALTDAAKQEAVTINLLTVIVSAVTVVIFIVVAILMSTRIGRAIVSSIVDPLKEVEIVADELTKGNLHSNLEYRSEDEIGRLAHSLRKSIRILGSYVDDIGHAMKEFSDGNFDVKPEVEWKGDFEAILDSFMLFEKSMSETVTGIQRVAGQVKGGAEQVAASASDLAQGATDQAGVTEELTATLESVSEQVIRNAENAKHISSEVEAVGSDIVTSNGKMQEMVESMSEINDASAEISKIIATINDIASQTNLLALNASIEAARAGEAGKGFAVVADQVSLLAAQSAEAAHESTALIESSVRAVEKGMVIAEETAKQLEHAVNGSQTITQKVTDMAGVLDQQAEAIEQINQGVGQINDVVQTNSATSEECAAASQEMSSQSEVLESLIAKFKVSTVE